MSPCCCWAEDILFCIYPVPVLRSLFTDLQEAHLGQHVKHSIFTPHSTLARFNQDTRNSCKFSSPLPQLPLSNPTHTHTHTQDTEWLVGMGMQQHFFLCSVAIFTKTQKYSNPNGVIYPDPLPLQGITGALEDQDAQSYAAALLI